MPSLRHRAVWIRARGERCEIPRRLDHVTPCRWRWRRIIVEPRRTFARRCPASGCGRPALLRTRTCGSRSRPSRRWSRQDRRRAPAHGSAAAWKRTRSPSDQFPRIRCVRTESGFGLFHEDFTTDELAQSGLADASPGYLPWPRGDDDIAVSYGHASQEVRTEP